MSNFIKYPSIENSYQKKTIDFFLRIFPDLDKCDYAIEEKIDGCNISIIVKPNSEILYCSRNKMLGDLNEFYGLGTTIKTYESELQSMIQFARDNKSICTFYCEYFGKGIQDRVNYGPEKQLRILNVRVGEEFKSPKYLYSICEDYNLEHILVPVLGIVSGLEEALDFNSVYVNTIYPESNSYEEGVVIKPLHRVYTSNNDEIFLLKKKNPSFAEKQKKTKTSNDISDECSNIITDFCEYITESRLYSVFSKEGRKIEDKSEMGYFIKLVIKDAVTDYNKENNKFPEECEKYIISSASKKCAQIILSLF